MKIFFAITLPIFLLSSCAGSKIVQVNLCENGKHIEVYKEKKASSKEQKGIVLYFDTGFNSNVRLMVNEKIVIDTLIVTSSISDPIFCHYIYEPTKIKQILKIQTDVDCLEVELDKKYNVLGLYNYSDKWILSYRKELPIFE